MKLKVVAFFFCSVIFTVAFADSAKIDFWSDIPPEPLSKKLVESMGDEELLAQILMFGWAGAEPSDLLNSWVIQRGLGSVKVFGWNTDNIQKVAKSVRILQQEAASRSLKIPLFVATDQEGGWIRHVKGETSDTPGNLAIGASGYPLDAYYSGFYINREIRALGINMNFAPTVDLYTNLNSSVIGPRSFGSDPVDSGILGEAFAAGSMDAGVIPTAKHFPGHGDTSLDSHGRLPQIEIDARTLVNRELVPFEYLIKAKIPAIMSGHLSFPQIESDGTPASLSKKFLTDILRRQMNYDGLIITDDMMMNGATLFAGSFHRAVMMAIEAGNDIIISSTTAGLYDNMWTRNLERMRTNSEFKERVKDAARRVIFTKLNYFKSENHAPLYPDENSIFEHIPDKDGQKFFLEQACRSVSVYKQGTAFPLKPAEGERVLIAGPFLALYSEGRKRYPNVSTFHFSYELKNDNSNFDNWNAASLVSVADSYDTIIICVYDKHTANIAKRLRYMDKRVVILSIMSPVFVLDDFDWADTILCGYSYSGYSFAALFGALSGEFIPQGIVPLKH
ncbi:glycoside hydrolase family 3 protein [Treponema succinifaciens]|uniref:beta-N-acetylhexosaminidase n=1 Tax=Treponema succinifaciens (strain ATCC 33096 / DSM 2489 / 6091) TaxID=869209 RepID=F2NXZ5_TRES6|nr:glycoside hydrolase family 3 protein [Treponema succinifaciens]AEB13746.1 glycoside hydrolase family 3 domain protein [Treponema succinifaciens DSM 2489]